MPDERGDLAPLEQAGQALPELVDHGVLAVLAHGEVERDPGDVDAELLRALDRPVHGRRLEEFLGRDAAPVQAGPADLVPLDDGDREPGCRAVEGGGVAARPAADHDDVELFLGGHRLSSSSVSDDVRPRPGPPEHPDRTGGVLVRRRSRVASGSLPFGPPAVEPAGAAPLSRAARPVPGVGRHGSPARRPGRSSGRPSGP